MLDLFRDVVVHGIHTNFIPLKFGAQSSSLPQHAFSLEVKRTIQRKWLIVRLSALVL